MESPFDIIHHFAIEGTPSSVEPLGEGFINDTYKVFIDGGTAPSYILQRKNHIVFPDVAAMMDNIKRVTDHIRKKVEDPLRGTLTIVPASDGKLFYLDGAGNYWAVCVFISDTVSYFQADTPELAYQGGYGLGLFHRQVSDFTEPLTEIIKGFHNIRFRFSQWDSVLAADPAGRCKDLAQEIGWVESRRSVMLDFWNRYEKGEIPSRVTHNDTKISNFLFNAADRKLLCAIDLDTLMSSTLLNDTGDALRSYTNTAAEDEPDLSKVGMSMDMFRAYMDGYLLQMGSLLTDVERKYLAFSGIYITFEQVLRFLMDYIDGDRYYKIKYPEHNLVRTRSQYKLLTSMESQLSEMEAYVEKSAEAVWP